MSARNVKERKIVSNARFVLGNIAKNNTIRTINLSALTPLLLELNDCRSFPRLRSSPSQVHEVGSGHETLSRL